MGKRTNTAVWLEKYSRWQIKVQKDGERRSFTSSTPGRTGQREANKKADEWLEDEILDSGTRISILYNQWMERLKRNTSRGHWTNYEGYWNNWICNKIGHLKINKLNEDHIQDIIDTAADKGKLSKKTLLNLRACLASLLKFCRKKHVTKLIIEDIEIPATAHIGERTILQPNDLSILFACDTTRYRNKEIIEPHIYAYRFEVVTGLRPGELKGLKWDDIVDGIVRIKRSINKYEEITRGKNDNAQRAFALTPLTKNILFQQRIYQINNNIKSDYVFSDEDGEPIRQQTYYKHWIRYCISNKISKCTTYELRHTFVSVAKRLPEGFVKDLVGHSQNMDTFGIYGHDVNGDMQKAANLIHDAFKDILKKKL